MKINWSAVQIAFIAVLFATMRLGFSPPHEPQNVLSRSPLGFRIGLGLFCLLGAVAAARLKPRQLPATDSAAACADGADADGPAISVTYRNTFDAARRCERYTAVNRPTSLLFLAALSFILAIKVMPALTRFHRAAPLLLFPALHLVAFLGWIALYSVIARVLLRARFPYPTSVRLCTTMLTPAGLRDVVPEGVIAIPWSAIREIREFRGNLFFWRHAGGCFIPRSAFAHLDEARRYHRAAVTLWRSDGTEWPDDVPAVVDRTKAGPTTPPGPSDNPYAAPLSDLRDDDFSGPSPYARVIRYTAVVFLLESFVVIAIYLTR